MTPPKHSRLSLARRLRLQQLAVFEKVVEAGSILAASNELAMSQPAVSKSIQELEAQLGSALFVRGKRGVTLTEFGRLFEHHARTMLAELRHMAEALNAAQSGSAGHVVVGTLITASATLLPDAIHRLQREAPEVVVTVRVGSNAMLFPSLARGEIDVVVGVLPADAASGPREAEGTRLAHVPLHDEGLCIVAGREHPLAQQPKLQLAELQDLQWIVPTPESVAYPAVRAYFHDAGLPLPRRRVESVSMLTNLVLLATAPVVALMPRSAVQRFARAGLLTLLAIDGPRHVSAVGYTVRAEREPTAATARFLAALRASAHGADEAG